MIRFIWIRVQSSKSACEKCAAERADYDAVFAFPGQDKPVSASHHEEALIGPPARAATVRTTGLDPSSAGPWVSLRRPAAPDRRSRSENARRPPRRKRR